MILRGRLQPAPLNAASVDRRGNAVEIDVGYAVASQYRGFYLQHPPLRKKAAHVGQKLCAAFQSGPGGRGLPDRAISHDR